jgi:hypothetical protein
VRRPWDSRRSTFDARLSLRLERGHDLRYLTTSSKAKQSPQGAAPQRRTFPARYIRCKQGRAFANRFSRNRRLLEEEKERLRGHPDDQQEGRRSYCDYYERPEMMILGLTAQWAPFCAWRNRAHSLAKLAVEQALCPASAGRKGRKMKRSMLIKIVQEGAKPTPASLRRVRAGRRRRRHVCSSVSDALVGSLRRNERKSGQLHVGPPRSRLVQRQSVSAE